MRISPSAWSSIILTTWAIATTETQAHAQDLGADDSGTLGDASGDDATLDGSAENTDAAPDTESGPDAEADGAPALDSAVLDSSAVDAEGADGSANSTSDSGIADGSAELASDAAIADASADATADSGVDAQASASVTPASLDLPYENCDMAASTPKSSALGWWACATLALLLARHRRRRAF